MAKRTQSERVLAGVRDDHVIRAMTDRKSVV